MADWVRARLVAAAGFLLLSLVSWPAQAGTETDPEITDNQDDTELQGTVPFGQVFPVSDGVDLLKAWVDNETATDVVLAILVAGDITLLNPLLTYDFEFHVTSNGTDHVASAHWAGSFSATGVSSGVAAEGNVLKLTVPKTALGVFRGDVLSGLFVTSEGTLVSNPVSSQLDRAPDSGTATRTYNVTQGTARGGSATDVDGDGLLDSKEVTYFGNITQQNGTGDPDGDGLNNTKEFDIGTDPTKADTDGDFLDDGKDEFPLDRTKPADSDKDGLTDSWERDHFQAVNAQDGTGDPDKDGLNNTRELALGTDPNLADTDGDGAIDSDDSDPLDPSAGAQDPVGETLEPKPELYAGAGMFALAATFILLALAKGI